MAIAIFILKYSQYYSETEEHSHTVDRQFADLHYIYVSKSIGNTYDIDFPDSSYDIMV